jgi:hypothetical protein
MIPVLADLAVPALCIRRARPDPPALVTPAAPDRPYLPPPRTPVEPPSLIPSATHGSYAPYVTSRTANPSAAAPVEPRQCHIAVHLTTAMSHRRGRGADPRRRGAGLTGRVGSAGEMMRGALAGQPDAVASRPDLREALGPEFAAFEIEDLNPKRFVHKHLSGDGAGTTSPVRRPAESRPETGADGHLREL